MFLMSEFILSLIFSLDDLLYVINRLDLNYSEFELHLELY
jgi:hypothetical protein